MGASSIATMAANPLQVKIKEPWLLLVNWHFVPRKWKMISEIDIADWEKIDIVAAKEALDNMEDFSMMGCSVNPIGAYCVLEKFIKEVELLQKKMIKQVPALFKAQEFNG